MLHQQHLFFFCECLLTGVFTLIVSKLCASLFTCYTRRWLALVCLYAPFSALCDIVSFPFVHVECWACASFAVVCYFSLSCQFFFTCRRWASVQLHGFFHCRRRHQVTDSRLWYVRAWACVVARCVLSSFLFLVLFTYVCSCRAGFGARIDVSMRTEV